MALEVMQAEMLQQLRNRGADARRLDEYIEVWTDAFDRIGERLPCPSCFADYGTGRLTRRPTRTALAEQGANTATHSSRFLTRAERRKKG